MNILLILAATTAAFVAIEGRLLLGKHMSSSDRGDKTVAITGPTRLAHVKFDRMMSRYKIEGKETWAFFSDSNFKKPLFVRTGPTGWKKVYFRHNDKVSSVRQLKSNCVKKNWDYWGADIKRVTVSGGVSSCIAVCQKTKGCKSIATRGKNCWLKNTAYGKYSRAQTGVTSVNMSCAPVDGGWTSFGAWSKCSKSCGGGNQKRTRTCSKPKPFRGGKKCSGSASQSKACNTGVCPVRPSGRVLTFPGHWGHWHGFSTCPKGGFAVALKQQVEKPQGKGDDTALNSICLVCSRGGEICSGKGFWGTWKQSRTCPGGFNAAAFKIEKKMGHGTRKDDTSGNDVGLNCKSGGPTVHAGNGGKWGKWMKSQPCPSGQVICGLKTRVEKKQGRGDDTALNGVVFQCCK